MRAVSEVSRDSAEFADRSRAKPTTWSGIPDEHPARAIRRFASFRVSVRTR
jgi:hypothetical protein